LNHRVSRITNTYQITRAEKASASLVSSAAAASDCCSMIIPSYLLWPSSIIYHKSHNFIEEEKKRRQMSQLKNRLGGTSGLPFVQISSSDSSSRSDVILAVVIVGKTTVLSDQSKMQKVGWVDFLWLWWRRVSFKREQFWREPHRRRARWACGDTAHIKITTIFHNIILDHNVGGSWKQELKVKVKVKRFNVSATTRHLKQR
jgi:hypothetical protein